VLLVARKKRRLRMDAAQSNWFYPGVMVSIKPAVPGKAHYRVKLKVKHQWLGHLHARGGHSGEQADGAHLPTGTLIAYSGLQEQRCPQYKVIGPAQHGFARTAARAHWGPGAR
jgi:hypothetical protein